MEQDAVGNDEGLLKLLNDSDERPRSAVNSVVLDYYKKFGRKRDLEQYFSLSTAQSDIRDPRSLFWRRMKEQSDTSDSGEKKSEESSNEICRISIKCSIPERSEVEKRDSLCNNDSESPPIITDVLPMPSPSADESIDDDHSQKSADGTLDTSVNKPLSPTSSITSQRKLEWDSLADVGYGNESDRKTSASSLSTLEREVLAQKQQYTLDFKQTSDLGLPTAHSTPVDTNDDKLKGKKGQGKKTISISRKDVDFVEVRVPRNVENAQPINVNLTKQFSVNLQQDGGLTIDNFKKDITISPEKNIDDAELNSRVKIDKEVQTSLLRSKDRSYVDCAHEASTSAQKAPILISLNTLKWKQRRKKIRNPRTKLKSKMSIIRKKIVHEKDKSGEQVSEAESFEYMPGHIYNQNQLRRDPTVPSNNNAGNKSSLESSAVHTTDSSKESKYSFSKDLDKTLSVLKSALKEKYDSKLKNKLVAEIINRLLKSKYGEGEQTPDFLSVLSLASRKTPTTSTSEADNTDSKVLHPKPKKSILRINKFDPNYVASTSQSAPNLTSVVNSNEPVISYLPKVVSSTTTETDLSNNSAKDVTSSDTILARTSSEELYKKYIDALKREEAYKRHLRDKELFLRQKLVASENALKVPTHVRTNHKLKELIKDLTRNNYDDGSGDASKLEGGSSTNFDINRQRIPRKHRSHSVFTLSSGNSDVQNRSCLKNRLHTEIMNSPRAGPSNRVGNLSGSLNRPPVAVTDSSVQVNINFERETSRNPPNLVEEGKYVCLCTEKCPVTIPQTGTIPQPECSIHPASSSLEDDVNTKLRSMLPKKQKTIIECTRCLQTKISLQPKISDPSVSDINIIHSADCVKLINELYRKVSQPSSEGQCSNEKEDSNSNTCKSSKDYIRQNRDERDNLINDGNDLAPLTDQQTDDQNINQACVGCQKIFTNQPECISDNIVIPIQGTNMMLKVSIGGKTMQVKDEQIPTGTLPHRKMIDKEIVTDEIKTSLKGTSILDECSKFVQAENAGDISKNINTGAPCGIKINKEHNNSPRETQILSCTDNERQTELSKNDHIYTSNNYLHTYPKKVQICDKKPFLRSNTDTGNLGANPAIQTKMNYNNQNTLQSCFRTETQTQPFLSPMKHSRSEDDYETRTQTIKITPSVHSTSESSNYSSGDRPKRCNIFKDKSSTEFKETKDYEIVYDEEKPKDLILDMIKDITKRYSKKDTGKRNKKKCFKEIVTALSYLLDTDDSGDGDQEFTKKSQSSKGSREQSSQSELVANHILNEAQGSKSALRQRSCNSPMLPGSSNKSVKPQKSTMETCARASKTESPGRDRTQNPNCSNKSGGENSDIVFSKTEQAALKSTCDMGCGCDRSSDCKDCMGPSIKPETGSTCAQSSRSEKRKTGSDRQTTFEKAPHMETDSSGNEWHRFEKQEPETVTNTWNKESLKPTQYESSSNASNKNKTTCDMGCGCDGSSDCKDCVEHHGSERCSRESSRPKYQYEEAKCDSTKNTKNTWDDVVTQSSKYGSGTCSKQPARFEEQVVKRDSHENTKTTYDKACGSDGSKEREDCVGPDSPKFGVGRCSKEPVRSEKEQGRCGSSTQSKITCNKVCGCDGINECEDCMGPQTSKYRTDRNTKESGGLKKQESRCGSPKKFKTTCDKGCGCDGSEECEDCKGPHSPIYESDVCSQESVRSKRQENRCGSPKKPKTTCDRSCSCDGSQECKNCKGLQAPKYRSDACNKESVRPKRQENRCGSPKKPKKTCDKGCGCDGSQDCEDCKGFNSPKHGSDVCSKESVRSKRQENRCGSPKKPKTTFTCDRGRSCDGSQECKDCKGPQCTKYESDACSKESMRRKKQESRCGSPKKTKITCDKACGCDGSQECKDCVEPHSPRRKTGKCGNGPIKSTKQEARCKPPTKTKTTCDKGCGCDGSSDCKECAEPHSPRYGKCGKESVRPKNRERSISPNKMKTTCDRGCGSDSSQNKICNCKTGRCGKENSIKQDASLSKKFVNRCVQSTVKRVKSLYSHCNDSSDISASTDQPCCSTDSPTAKLVNKIKRECDKYQKRCRVTCKNCEASSSTTVSCDHCKRHCRRHKCRCHRTKSMEKVKKKCVAYNLIVQTSDSMISEDTVFDRCRPLQNVVVRVPKCKQVNVPFKEACAKIEQKLPYCSTSFEPKPGRSQSWPNECGISSTDDVKMANQCTVREYLEKNRPDFVDKCASRQNCIRMISETRARERSELRKQMVGLGSLQSLNDEELIYLAKELGFGRRRPLQQKIISEREMKKHSEKIYKSLPEVIQKKEDAKKESIKKTNLLMANIFKKNLQKKTLSGDVNISNYSQVVKI